MSNESKAGGSDGDLAPTAPASDEQVRGLLRLAGEHEAAKAAFDAVYDLPDRDRRDPLAMKVCVGLADAWKRFADAATSLAPALAAELLALRAEAGRLRVLAERAYPGLKPTGLCSRCHPADRPPPAACTVCYPELDALLSEHARVNRELVAERDALRERAKKAEAAVALIPPCRCGCPFEHHRDYHGQVSYCHGDCDGRCSGYMPPADPPTGEVTE